MDNIKVAIKVRPLIKREKDEKLPIQWVAQDNSIAPLEPELKKRGEPFYFDHIFDTCETNEDVFNVVAKPIVEAAVKGFNGTIFAYGQTGSGKTFTMMGEEENPGVIPLAIDYIFDTIANTYGREFLLRISYIEIYNEKINDLLDKTGIDLKIKEEKTGQAIVMCKEEVINCPENVLLAMRKGDKHRRIGETNMNERSSRSHTIFRITIESRESNSDSDGAVQVSQLNLVDLAGSERAKQSGATGERFNEGRHINLSLSALGLVIMQLSEAQENPHRHVNFRDSKLTRILQASLGGNAMTTIICAVTPAAFEETQCTLAFASRAKNIKNKPHVNEVLSEAALIKRYTKQMAKLTNELNKAKNPNYVELESKLIEKDCAIQLLEERIELLKTRIVSGSNTPEGDSFKGRTKRRRTWGGAGIEGKGTSYQLTCGLPTIKELEKSPEKEMKKEHIKQRQSFFQTCDITDETFQTAFTDFELDLIRSEQEKIRLSDGSSGGDNELVKNAVTLRSGRNVHFMDDITIMDEQRKSLEVTPEKRTPDPKSPDTPKAVLRTRIHFLAEEYNSLSEFTKLEKQIFVEDAVKAAMVEHNNTVESLRQALADSEQSHHEILEKYTRQMSGSSIAEKETSSIFANGTYFDEINDSDPRCDSVCTNDTQNMESLSICDTSVVNDTTINEFDDSKKSKDITNANYNEFMRQIGEKSVDELVLVVRRLLNSKMSLEEENIKLKATVRQKVRESDDVKNDIRDLRSGIEKLQENFQGTIDERNSSIDATAQEKSTLENTIKELEKLKNCRKMTEVNDETTPNLINEYKKTIDPLTSNNIELSSNLINKMEELDRPKENRAPLGDHDCAYREQITSVMERNIHLESENIELSNSLMEKIEEYDCLMKKHEVLLGKLSLSSPNEESNKLLEISMNLMNDSNFESSQTAETRVNKEKEFNELQFSNPTVDDLLRMSIIPGESIHETKLSNNNENVEASKLKIEMLCEQVKDLTVLNEKLSNLKIPSCKECAHLVELKENRRMLKNDIKTVDHKLRELQTKYEREFADTEILRTKASEDMNLSVCDITFNASMIIEGGLNVTLVEERAQSLYNELESLRANHDKLSTLYKEKCDEIEKLHDISVRESTPTSATTDSPRLRRDDPILDRIQTDMNQLKNDMRHYYKNITSMQKQIEALKNEKQCFEAKLAKNVISSGTRENIESLENEVARLSSEMANYEIVKEELMNAKSLLENEVQSLKAVKQDREEEMTKSSSIAREKIKSLENEVARLCSEIQNYEILKEKLESTKSLSEAEVQSLIVEKQDLEEKLTESSSLAREKIESLENEVARLCSDIRNNEFLNEELKNTKSLLETEVQALKVEKQDLKGKLTFIESSPVVPEKLTFLENEVARLSSEIQNYEMLKKDLENSKFSLEAQVQSLTDEKEEEKLASRKLIITQDEKIESLENKVASLVSEIENSNIVKVQLEDARSSFVTEIELLKVQKQHLDEKLAESSSLTREKIESLENEVVRLRSEIQRNEILNEELKNTKSSLEAEVQALKVEKQDLKGKAALNESSPVIPEKIKLLENEVARLCSEIQNYEILKENLESTKSLSEAEVQSLIVEKQDLEEKLTESSSFAREKIESLENEVARLRSDIRNNEILNEELKNTKTSLETEVQALKVEKQDLKGKITLIESSPVVPEKLTFLENEVARLSSDIQNYEMLKEDLENSKLSLEAQVQSLKDEKEMENLASTKLITTKDEKIESLENKVASLVTEIENSNIVKVQLENAKSSLVTEIELLKIEKESFEEVLTKTEISSLSEKTIGSWENIASSLTSEIENFNVTKQMLEEAKLCLESKVQLLQTENEALKRNLTNTDISTSTGEKLEFLETELSRFISKTDIANMIKSELEDTKLSMSEELNLVRGELTARDELIEELQHSLKNLDESNFTLKAKLERLSSEKNEIIVDPCTHSCESVDSPNNNLESYDKHEQSLKLKLKETTNDLEKYVEIDEELDDRLTRVKTMENELNILKTNLENKSKALLAERSNFETNQTNLSESLNKLENENSTLTTISETLRSKLDCAINDLNECTKENGELKKRLEEFQRFEDTATKEKFILSNEIATLQAEITNLRESINSLRQTIEILEEKNSSLTMELEKSKIFNKKSNDTAFTETPAIELQLNTKETVDTNDELSKLDAVREEFRATRMALETEVDNLKIEKNVLHETLANLRQTMSVLDAKNATLNEELYAIKAEKENLASRQLIENSDSQNNEKTIESLNIRLEELNEKLHSYSTENDQLRERIVKLQGAMKNIEEERKINVESEGEKMLSIGENNVEILSYEKNLVEIESARRSIKKEIMSLKPASDSVKLDEKSTSELFSFFVMTIMSKERELMKTLSDNFDREKRKLEDNNRQSMDAEKRVTLWAKELEAENERIQQDVTRQETKNSDLCAKIEKLENLLMESNHENNMLKEKMKVLEADFDNVEADFEKTPRIRHSTTANLPQEKERFIRETTEMELETREMELSSKLRNVEKQYKEKLEELTSIIDHQKTRNIEMSNNLEGLCASEINLKNIIDKKTTDLAKCNSTIERIQRELDSMTESYNKLSTDNANKTRQIDEITRLLKSKCDKMSEYKTKLETIMPDYEMLKEQSTERQLRLEKYKTELECLRTESEKNISSLKDCLDSEEIKCSGYRKQLLELTNKNKTLQMELVDLRAKCDKLEVSNEKMVKSMRNSTSKIRAEEEMENLRDHNRIIERNLDGASNRINELQDMKTGLMKDLEELRVKFVTTCNENEEMKNVLSSHRSSVADTIKLKEKYETLLQANNRLEMEIADKRSRFALMESKIETSTRENEELRLKNAELDTEMEDIVAKINELTKENGELDDASYAKDKKIEELTALNCDLETRVKSFAPQIAELNCQRDKLRDENEKLSNTLETLTIENSDFRTKLSHLDRSDSLTCGSSAGTSPAVESIRNGNRRQSLKRQEMYNQNRRLETVETNDETGNCRCEALQQQVFKRERELALKNAKIVTLELKIDSEIFPHERKCADLKEMLASVTRKNKLLKSEMKKLEEKRAEEMSSECERCKHWRLNKCDQASQCLPEPIYMSGMSSGFVQEHVKMTKLEKDKATLKALCRNRAQQIHDLKVRLKEMETCSKTNISTNDENSAMVHSSTQSTSTKPDSTSNSRQAMKENVPAIWDNQRPPYNLGYDRFN